MTEQHLLLAPASINAELRIERHDWVFVGHADETNENPPALAMWVRDEAQLAVAVRAFVARETENDRYPYIFLAPTLGQAFEDQATRELVVAEKGHAAQLPAAAWEAVCDFTTSDKATAEVRRRAETSRTYTECYLIVRKHVDGVLAQFPALDPDVRGRIHRQLMEIGSNWDNEYPVRCGSLDGLLAARFRTQIHAGMYSAERAAGGWQVLLTSPNSDRLKTTDQPWMSTPDGAPLRSEDAYRALRNEEQILPVSAAALFGFISEHHEEQSEDCDGLPSQRQIRAWMKAEDISDPTPVAAIAPTAGARLAARGLTDAQPPVAVLPYLAWSGRVTLLAAREKDGKSTLVGSAVAAFTSGNPWIDEVCAPVGCVLWFHEEAEDDVIGRLQQYGANLDSVHLIRLPQGDIESIIRANAKRLKPALIVVDSLTRYAAGRVTDSTRATQWEPIMSEFLRVAQASGAGILILHHAEKSNGRYRDSTEIGAAVDMLVEMPHGLQGNRQTLEGKGRIVGVAPYKVTIELSGTTHHLVDGAHRAGAAKTPTSVASLGERDHSVLATLVRTMTYTEWFEASSLLSKKSFDAIRERLVAAQAVKKTKDGRYQTA